MTDRPETRHDSQAVRCAVNLLLQRQLDDRARPTSGARR